jgi:hypothetical protein
MTPHSAPGVKEDWHGDYGAAAHKQDVRRPVKTGSRAFSVILRESSQMTMRIIDSSRAKSEGVAKWDGPAQGAAGLL